MTDLVLVSNRLNLVLQSPEEVLRWVESLPPSDRAEVSPDWLDRLKKTPPGDFWKLMFSVQLRDEKQSIGGCGFKGPPDDDGAVEIAYGIDEQHRRRGYASEAVESLRDFAFSTRQVKLVRAHTKKENEASARVLTKCGFSQKGEVTDPEDGLVQRWECYAPEAIEEA
jgi:[ribosomal protein S5]-alanine N-acetyltransferase